MRKLFSIERIPGPSCDYRPAGKRCQIALSTAAYIRRTKLYAGGRFYAFTDRGRDLLFVRSVLPANAPEWLLEPHLRWHLADEAAENGRGPASQIRAWHICADLPVSLPPGRWMDVTDELVRLAMPDDVVVDIAAHVPVDKPAHVHILIAPRRPVGEAYGDEIPGLELAIRRDLQELWLDWLAKS